MKAGDQWKLYIPYPLAYGKDGTEGILGYSTLIFDVNLVDIFPLKGTGKSIDDTLDAKNSYHRILERREYCSLLQCSFLWCFDSCRLDETGACQVNCLGIC